MFIYIFRTIIFGICFVCLVGTAERACAVETITIPFTPPNDHRSDYNLDLLKLALDKSVPKYGDYKLKIYDLPTEQLRALRLMKDGRGIDLTWSMTSKEREKEFLPIRIPMQKGLLAHRIFLIKPKDQHAFNKVKNVEDLKKFRAGQGYDWPDTEILQKNGLPTTTCSRYQFCFIMLNEKRFDYFPRGVCEPWGEIKEHLDMDLTVEKTILLRYPSPLYFFVSRDNPALAKRVEYGLRLALKDGSFDKLFYNHPMMKEAFEKAKLSQRKIIDIENPNLPPETPIDDKSLWINLNKVP
ncbi:amino acid ABC transporter substrate-binding protein [Desulfovibrio sp. JC010]|uniref:amino acid ABC transporter substrate-binding protein n=1 Tax=Desulfovibrio sp. JC010 TaxID=2593641 RepID=UPI0013D845AE|nr:amino acid ABC transporter substrate-binding protein [Desulfovibrio sp. JC010]NDV27929.1 amino acid ABC transporter substrate-binding protein [Desulfovibrio sp. JC010]